MCVCVCVEQENMFVYVDGGFECSLREAHVCMWMGALCSWGGGGGIFIVYL